MKVLYCAYGRAGLSVLPLILKEVKNQINFYMKGKKINFDIPLNPKGTIFQKKSGKILKK